jgi:hypothetical protein
MSDKPQFKLTPDERRQVFAGTLAVIRRPHKPDLEAGADLVVSSTRGGRQVLDRDSGKTIDIEPIPRLWITLKGWHLRAGQTEWETDVTIHDHREDNRQLARGGIGGLQREAGLRTRSGTRVIHSAGEVKVVEKRVPKKGEQRENWTAETERGYGGGGGRTLDERDADGQVNPAPAVDDATLKEFADRALTANLARQAQQRKQEQGMRREMKVAGERRRAMRQRARATSTRKVEVTVAHADGTTEEAVVELSGGAVVAVTDPA